MSRRPAFICASIAVSLLSSTAAQAACWSPTEVTAARVRDLDTMLMVAALRCRVGDPAIVKRYNAFVKGSKPALVAANTVLRQRFARGGGINFDTYVTRVANRYGAGVEGLGCFEMSQIVATATAQGASYAKLHAVALANAVEPSFDELRCGVQPNTQSKVIIAAAPSSVRLLSVASAPLPRRPQVALASLPLPQVAPEPTSNVSPQMRLTYDIKDSLYLP